MYSDIDKYADEYKLPPLPYAYDALEKEMDAATVEVHYTGHHQAYTNNLNKVLKEWRASGEKSDLAKSSILEIIKKVNEVPSKFFKGIRNNGGGYVNHDIFFSCMGPKAGGEPTGKIANDIKEAFGSFDAFKTQFTEAAKGVFGSGYAWLSRDGDGKLKLTTSANQESAISENLKPILVLDVWEHAYYLKYKNKRPDFINAWWKLVDWNAVDKLDKWWSGK